MSWWPWTSVARLYDAKEEIERLRAQNDKLTDALVRLKRFESGMAETPRPPKREVLPMPPELKEHFKAIKNSSIRKELRDRAYKRHGRGEPWEKIVPDYLKPPEPEED